ncbi:hypothetical protein PoB_004222600 [Plakobranchus ocellatus]|uniref:Uncharacterized protein n=1 Tax=Plakobranchus ocellatus TaxID=259542 RepID=A0AAV4BA80_9GAST|nr:hypothetical protein PoB_004222600 [Plakobranchus ocellatus]
MTRGRKSSGGARRRKRRRQPVYQVVFPACWRPGEVADAKPDIDISIVLKTWFLYKASPHQGDLRLSGTPSGQGAGGRAQTGDKRVAADFRADSLSTMPPTPP